MQMRAEPTCPRLEAYHGRSRVHIPHEREPSLMDRRSRRGGGRVIQMRIASLSVDSRSNSPVLVLSPLVVDPAHPRLLPIWIGTPEATSILLALQGADMPRPLTHDLMRNVVETLGFVV